MYRRTKCCRIGRKVLFAGYAASIVALAVAGINSQPVKVVQGWQPVNREVSTESVECERVEANPYDVPADGNGNPYPVANYVQKYDANDRYYLAKIVKCEAGICDMETKIRHALVVLNRVQSEQFPDTVYDVITQYDNGVYQFSPVIPGGTWYTTEPDKECYQAVEYAILMQYDISHGATYFEATGSDSVWHQQALVEVCESDGVRFYVEP